MSDSTSSTSSTQQQPQQQTVVEEATSQPQVSNTETKSPKQQQNLKEPIAVCVANSDSGAWFHKTKFFGSFPARSNHWGLSFSHNKFLVQGGVCDNKNLHRTIYVFERQANNTWFSTSAPVQNPQDAPPRIWNHTVVYYPKQNSIYVFGGRNHLRCFQETFVLQLDPVWLWSKIVSVHKVNHRYSVPLSTSTANTASMNGSNNINNNKLRIPCRRHDHTAVLIGNEMVVFGGMSDHSLNRRVLNDVWALDLDNHMWRDVIVSVKNGVPVERYSHAAIALDDGKSMMIWGGVSKTGHKLNDCWIFDLGFKTWRQVILTGTAPQARVDCQLVSIGSGLVIGFGGYSNMRYHKDFFAIDLVKNRYIAVDVPRKELPSARKGHSLTMLQKSGSFDNVVVMLGGNSRKRGRLDDMWSIDVPLLKNRLLYTGKNLSQSLGDHNAKYARITKCIEELEHHMSNPEIESKKELVPVKNLDKGETVEVEFEANELSALYMDRMILDTERRDFNKAIDALKKLKDISSTDVSSLETAALVYYHCGDLDQAREHLDRVDRNQLSVEGHILLAQVYLACGSTTQATNCVKDLLDSRGKQLKSNQVSELSEWRNYLSKLGTPNTRGRRGTILGPAPHSNLATTLPDQMIAYTETIDDAFYEAEFDDATEDTMNDQTEADLRTSVPDDQPNQQNSHDIIIAGGASCGLKTILQNWRAALVQSVSPNECEHYRSKIRNQTVDILFACVDLIEMFNASIEIQMRESLDIVFNRERMLFEQAQAERIQAIRDLKEKNRSDYTEDDFVLVGTFCRDRAVRTVIKSLYEILSYMDEKQLCIEPVSTLLTSDIHYYMNEQNVARIICSGSLFPIIASDVLRIAHKQHFFYPAHLHSGEEEQAYESDYPILELMYKKIPYNIVSVRDVQSVFNVESGESIAVDLHQRFPHLSCVVLVANLADVFSKHNSSLNEGEEEYAVLSGGVTYNKNSSSSIVASLRLFHAICNDLALADKPVVILFTHCDEFARMCNSVAKVNSPGVYSLQNVLPKFYLPAADSGISLGKSASVFLEKCFNDLNETNSNSTRRLHFRYFDSNEQAQAMAIFKFVDSVANAVRAHNILKDMKML